MAIRKERLQERDSLLDPKDEGIHFDRFEIDGIEFLTPEEGRAMFDREAQEAFGISGDEFFRRWDNGEYGPVPDTPEGRKLGQFVMMIPFARRIPA